MCITTGGIGEWQRMRMWRSGAPLLLLLAAVARLPTSI